MHLCWDQVSDTSSRTSGRGQVGLSLKSWCLEAAQKLVKLSFLLWAERWLGCCRVVVVNSAMQGLAVLISTISLDGCGRVARVAAHGEGVVNGRKGGVAGHRKGLVSGLEGMVGVL